MTTIMNKFVDGRFMDNCCCSFFDSDEIKHKQHQSPEQEPGDNVQ